MATPAPLKEGLTLFDRYVLEAPLGRARTGHSWRARDLRLEMSVVVKVFDQHPAIATLEQGVRDHLNVTHPNLARLFEFVGDSDRCAVVTEYVEGRSLGTLLRNRLNGCFEMVEIRRWIEQLLSCVKSIHAAGRVHGDLNLENLLINDRNELKVLDLGLREGRLSSRTGDLAFSSPSSTSPQTLDGGKAQPVDDLYSIAACTYELLTGKPLFAGGNVAIQIESKVPALVNARRAELGVGGEPVAEEWEAWINSCLAKERRDRPQNAEAVLEIVRRSAGTTTRTQHVAPVEQTQPTTAGVAPTAYMTSPQGTAIPVVLTVPNHSSSWTKIVVLLLLVVSAAGFYFGSWKPSRAELKQMEQDFQKLRQMQNKAPEEVGALREVEKVLEEFINKYSGVDIPYSERDDILRTQAEERLDACALKIKELERALATEMQKERDAKQAALKAAYDKATEVTSAVVSAKAKAAKWQALLDDFGDWDNPDSTQDNKMIAEARKALEKCRADQEKETQQMKDYGDQLQVAIDRALTIRASTTLTAGMKWKALNEQPKLPSKAPGEQELEFSKLEQTYEELKKELDTAARKETPEEPHTLASIFANSSFSKTSDTTKGEAIRAAQGVLKEKGMLMMEQPDGQPGKATHQSIAEFQLKNGLVANGELNDATLWLLGFEDNRQLAAKEDAAKAASKTASTSSNKKRIPKCPPKSIYDGFVGRTRLGKDQLFNRVNKEEYAKHQKYKAWQDKYGDLEEE